MNSNEKFNQVMEAQILDFANEPDTLNVIAFGGGRQSIYMTELFLSGKIPVSIDAILFADTGDEPAQVYAQIAKVNQRWFELYRQSVTYIRQKSLSSHIEEYLAGETPRASAVPLRTAPNGGLLWRQCTMDFKIRPLRRTIRTLMKKTGKKKANLFMGLAYEEMSRIKDSGVKYLRHLYPLVALGITTNTIQKWYADHGFGKIAKSSCIFCPYHSDVYWAKMKEERPSEFAFAVAFDKMIRNYPTARGECFLHRSLQPLDKVDFVSENQKRPELADECDGYCTT